MSNDIEEAYETTFYSLMLTDKPDSGGEGKAVYSVPQVMFFTQQAEKRAFKAGAQWQASQPNQGVPIDEIPEEWKDGRPVWLYFVNLSVTGPLNLGDRFWSELERIKRVFPEYCCWQKANWSDHNGGGWIWNNMSGRPYFAMLPPNPPTKE